MGRMKDYLLELQEKEMRNGSGTEGGTLLAKHNPPRKESADNQGAFGYSVQLETSVKTNHPTPQEIASTRFRRGSPGID